MNTNARNGIGRPVSRRQVLAGGAALGAAGLLGAPSIVRAEEESIKVGILQPLSGGLEALGNQGVQGAKLALEEANDAGGVLGGRRFEIVVADTKTDPKTAVERTNALIRGDEVNAIIGPVTSANRDAMQPTLERFRTPLFYATDYEGGVCSRYIWCYSALPDHWVTPLIPHVVENYGKRFYLLGSDYVWPQKMNQAIAATATGAGGEVLGEEYSPWGVKDYTSTLRKIEGTGADVIVLTVVGADAVTFVKQFTAAGLKSKIRLVFFGFSENYLAGLSTEESEGIVSIVNFTETLDKPEARAFVEKVRGRYGQDAIVSNTVDAHYNLTRFLIGGIERAGSSDKEAFIDAMGDQTLMSGNGEVHLRASDRHTDVNVLIVETKGGVLEIQKDIGRVTASDQCEA